MFDIGGSMVRFSSDLRILIRGRSPFLEIPNSVGGAAGVACLRFKENQMAK